MVQTKDSFFTRRELEIIEKLKESTIINTANQLNLARSTIDATLFRVRNKIQKAHNTVNVANNWKDSGKNPRLAKLLRRQS